MLVVSVCQGVMMGGGMEWSYDAWVIWPELYRYDARPQTTSIYNHALIGRINSLV